MTPTRITDLPSFIAIHQEQAQRVDDYLRMPKSNYQTLDASVQHRWHRSQDRYLNAINHRSRISLARIVVRRVMNQVDEASGFIDLHMVTLIPDIFAVSLLDAETFSVETIIAWASEYLGGHDFIAIVEAAYFPKWPHGQPTIAWHVHIMVLGSTYIQINRDLQTVRNGYCSLVDGIDAAHIQRVPRWKLEAKLLYMVKFPMRSYHPGPNKKTGRWAVSKPLLRTGELVKMHRVLASQQLDSMVFGGGAGKSVVDAIRTEALGPYQAELDLRLAQRERSLNLRHRPSR